MLGESEGERSKSGEGSKKDTGTAATNKSRLADLRVLRGTVTMQQTKMKNFIETPGRTMSLCELETRLGLLENYISRFNEVQSKLECEDPEEAKGDKRQSFEDTYIAIKSSILSLMDLRRPRVSLPSIDPNFTVSMPKTNASLPKIQIKRFSGNFTDWPDFYSTFKTLVEDNEHLTNVEKLSYLRGALDENPLQIISNLSLDNEGFGSALSLLKERYENKRLIFQSHIQSLFRLRPIEKNSVVQLRDLSDSAKAHMRALRSMADVEAIADGLLLQLLRGKLDATTMVKWEEEAPLHVLPSWDELSKFLDKRCQTLENMQYPYGNKPEVSNQGSPRARINTRKSAFTTVKVNNSCNFCQSADHSTSNCQKFIKLLPIERFSEAKRLSLCINCLKPGHMLKACKSTRCRYCNSKHHTLLHRHSPPSNSGASSSSDGLDKGCTSADNSKQNSIAMTSHMNKSNSSASQVLNSYDTLLATAVIEIQNSYGEFVPYRALLDSGSSLHFVAEHVVQQLRLKRSRASISVTGIGSTITPVKYKAQMVFKSRLNDYRNSFEALILPKITSDQHSCHLNCSDWKIPLNIIMADPHFNIPQPVDILIGASLFFELLSVGQIRLGDNLPVLQKTLLGWVISGGKSTLMGNCLIAAGIPEGSNDTIDELLQRFWEVEDFKSPVAIMSPEEALCEEHFVKNVRRDKDGRFVVRLPFLKEPSILGNSLEIVKRRFFHLEQRLAKNFELKRQYSEFLFDYLKCGHMERIAFDALPNESYFLPHHCIIKPESSSTKLRVVFDASCKTTSGYSLNDVLMVGPVVQNDLFSILIRFRSHKIALTADITKMYRQVQVPSPDANWQCIVWRESSNLPLEAYRLLTVTYGTGPASFLATRSLKQLFVEEESKYPIGAQVLMRDFYVDDMLSGSDTVEGAKIIRQEIEGILRSGGFELAKWCSNNAEVLELIDSDKVEKHLQFSGDSVVKTLGMIWQPDEDFFRFVYKILEHPPRVTKRSVLSMISRIFDPLGLVNPIIVAAKIFLQRLWSLKIAWDESLPQELHMEWISFYNQLDAVNRLRIPRYVMLTAARLEIHCFADASMAAYGACVYVRAVCETSITCNLLTAKSRVAPLKTISVPRLELCAALVAAELTERIHKIFASAVDKVYCWSDSKVTLAWLSSSPSKWSVFVGNRVAKIQNLTRNFQWNHVPSSDNPADLLSRGVAPQQLIDCNLWFLGPDFLRAPEQLWPQASSPPTTDIPERRKVATVLASMSATDIVGSSKFCNSYLKLINTFVYVYRFCKNSKIKSENASKRLYGPISVLEFENALKAVIRSVQKRDLSEDYRRLLSKRDIKPNSVLTRLNPFLDSDGLIRVGGRLENSKLDFAMKHPIVLPKSAFAKTLIAHYHSRHMHVGCQALLAIIRTRFWPIGGRVLAKQVVNHCIRCFRLRPRMLQQIMGQLPSPRVQPSPVFSHTGIDYCGPFFIKHSIRNRPPSKCYICVFICLCVKAVHLEVASSLTTEAFLSVLAKFMARRSNVKILYSDNATNFVGASRQLKELKDLFQSEQHVNLVHEFCQRDGIEWKFIPPRSPHFGGLWEAAIKQAKHHLHRVLGAESYSLDELQRVVCQVECILNSRPLTPMSDDVNDLQPLTPGHFLTGGPPTMIPEPSPLRVEVRLRSRWQHLQGKVHAFWSRWQNDYLQGLQQRVKWKSPHPNLKAGDLVLLKNENSPPLKWPLGRIVELHPGKDGYVRVATIKTVAGLFKRAVAKLCPLPDDINPLEASAPKAAGLCYSL